jgi:quercetin dioxygenase-like cupin family protein
MSRIVIGLICGVLLTLGFDALAEKESQPPETKFSRSVVVGPEGGKTRVAPSGKSRVTILAEGENAFIAKLWMAAGASVPLHRDASEEYIVVLEGQGTIWVDGAQSYVFPGSSVYMAAHSEVRFTNGDTPLVALQVFAGPGSAKKYDSWVE